jgi:hypothetical protein
MYRSDVTEQRISEAALAEMRSLAEKAHVTDWYEGARDPLILEIDVEEVYRLQAALLRAIAELERIYAHDSAA